MCSVLFILTPCVFVCVKQQTVCELELRGAAVCQSMFVCGGDPLDLCSESLIPPNIYSAGKTEHTGTGHEPACAFRS